MSVAANLALVALSIALLLGAMAAVKVGAKRFGLPPELQRKIVHVATGLYALTLPLTFTERWPVVVLVVVSVAVMLLLRLPVFSRSGLASTLHQVERRSHGEIYLSLAVGFLFFQSQGQPILYVLPILVLTLSDAAAALVGSSYGRRRFAVEAGHKSLEGVVAFFVVTWLLAMILLLVMTEASRPSVIVLGLIVAAFGALVEAESWRGLDNVFVPLSVHFLLASHLATPPAILAALAAFFIAVIAIVMALAPLLRLSRHAAGAYTILIVLVCSIVQPHNAILPVVAILAHLVARRLRPCRSLYPDLDLLAVIAGVSVFWLFVGHTFERATVDLFNLTFAAMAAAFLALALPAARRWLMIPAFIALMVAVHMLTGWAEDEVAWHGALWPWTAAALATGTVAGFLRPDTFQRYRSPRVLAVALVVPLTLFVTKGVLSP